MVAVTHPRSGFLASVASFSREALGWLIPMLLTAAVTAYVSYRYNQKANTQLVVQQQKISELQEFRQSGAQLDQALGRMSDALVDGEGLEAARREMRTAITANITDASAVSHLLGSGAEPYLKGLADLRDIVDQVDTIESGQALWQGSLNLMQQRRKLIRRAERQALST